MSSVRFMTNLLPDLYAFLKREAKREKITMREVLEQAITVYKREKRKEMIIKDCERLAEDTEYQNEMVELAEMGMEYYLEDIDNMYEDDKKV